MGNLWHVGPKNWAFSVFFVVSRSRHARTKTASDKTGWLAERRLAEENFYNSYPAVTSLAKKEASFKVNSDRYGMNKLMVFEAAHC